MLGAKVSPLFLLLFVFSSFILIFYDNQLSFTSMRFKLLFEDGQGSINHEDDKDAMDVVVQEHENMEIVSMTTFTQWMDAQPPPHEIEDDKVAHE